MGSGFLGRPEVETDHHAGRQHAQQRLEVAVAGGGEERGHRPALHGEIAVWPGRGAHPPPGPAGQLPRRDLGPADDLADDLADLVETHVEDVM
ncbi:MAG: hypothetical protein ACRDOH_09995 [Streptosporangiaceae bacterium]